MFLIEDEWHAEDIGWFATKAEAFSELQRLVSEPWDSPPNRAPCQSWETCGRRYVLSERDANHMPLPNSPPAIVLEVTKAGAVWPAA